MLMGRFGSGKSRRSGFQIESLEQRRLLSSVGTSSSAEATAAPNGVANTLDFNLDGDVNALDFDVPAANDNGWSGSAMTSAAAQSISTLAAKIIKLEGSFTGHYISTTTGEHALSFDITHCTHTGHFTGTVTFTNPEGKFPASVTGVIRSNRHVDITYNGDGFSGTMTGIATHTVGSFSGDYTNTTGPASHGTYHVGKA